MKKLLGTVIAAAVALIAAPTASADATGYFNTLESDYGWVIWDYPGNLAQGQYVCSLLYNDVNPHSWLTSLGYASYEATDLIMSARINLCPGNAVTAPEPAPPQLQYAL